jgi:hypothetical protein
MVKIPGVTNHMKCDKYQEACWIPEWSKTIESAHRDGYDKSTRDLKVKDWPIFL